MEDGTILKNDKPINTWLDRQGYKICKLNGVNYRVHRLIAQWFLPVCDETYETVNHKDGNKLNNNVDNLEWMTFSQNAKHSWRNGLAKPCKGETHGRSKLTWQQVEFIRKSPKPSKNGRGGVTAVDLAAKFNVCVATIRRVRRMESWNDPNDNRVQSI